MGRKEKQITGLKEIEAIMHKAKICYLAFSVNDQPYVVPLCYGYQGNTLYFHSAQEGKKLEMLKSNPNVSFAMQVDADIIEADKACNWSMTYKSVVGFGRAIFLVDQIEKKNALDLIMNQYTDGVWDYGESVLRKTTVFKVEIDEMTGKQSLD